MGIADRTYMVTRTDVVDVDGVAIKSGRKYRIETNGERFFADVFYNEEGHFVAKRVGGPKIKVGDLIDAQWELA